MAYFALTSVSHFDYKIGTERDVLAQYYGGHGRQGEWKSKKDQVVLVDLETLDDLLSLAARVGSDLIVSTSLIGPGYYGDESAWAEPFRGLDGKPMEDIVGSIIIYDGYME